MTGPELLAHPKIKSYLEDRTIRMTYCTNKERQKDWTPKALCQAINMVSNDLMGHLEPSILQKVFHTLRSVAKQGKPIRKAKLIPYIRVAVHREYQRVNANLAEIENEQYKKNLKAAARELENMDIGGILASMGI